MSVTTMHDYLHPYSKCVMMMIETCRLTDNNHFMMYCQWRSLSRILAVEEFFINKANGPHASQFWQQTYEQSAQLSFRLTIL